MTPDPVVFPAAQRILDLLRAELVKVASPPKYYRIVPGVEAIASYDPEAGVDEACQGMAWVRVMAFWACGDFPSQLSGPEAASGITPTSWAVQLELGVVRCGGGPGATMVPTDAQLTQAASDQLDDAAAMRRVGVAALTVDPELIVDAVFGPGPYDPLTAEGGAIGGSLHLTVQVPAIDC